MLASPHNSYDNLALSIRANKSLGSDNDFKSQWHLGLHLRRSIFAAKARTLCLVELMVRGCGIKRINGFSCRFLLSYMSISELIDPIRFQDIRQLSVIRLHRHINGSEPETSINLLMSLMRLITN